MRIAFPNLGAEDGSAVSARRTAGPVERLRAAWIDLVEDPPWPWLARADGIVPWLSTMDALVAAQRAGLALWGAAPHIATFVHDKAFAVRTCAERGLDGALAALVHALEPEEVSVYGIERLVARWPAWAQRNFTVKPRWGTSGRGRVAGVNGALQQVDGAGAAERFAQRMRERRGAVVEPWFTRVADLSSLWFVDEHQEPHLIGVTEQLTRRAGVYLGCDVVITDVGPMAGTAHDEDAIERARVIVEAAAREGYRGPCGVDAFVFRDPVTELPALRGVVELNARFTAGHVALGLIARQEPRPGARFRFRLDRSDVIARA